MKAARRLLSPLFSRTPSKPSFSAPLVPETGFAAIGDIHGSLTHLRTLVGHIESHHPDLPIVFVGDYIDRGEDSAGVIRWLHELETHDPSKFICLLGNHEQMCLRFLEEPERHAARWLQFGGLQTLASFNVTLGPGTLRKENSQAVSDALREAMGADIIDWLKARPLHWETGNVAVTHAGAHPAQPIAHQSHRNLLWGHREFLTTARQDGIWIVHGHTIVDEPVAEAGRISIDTGAYATGRLTAAIIEPDSFQFVTT